MLLEGRVHIVDVSLVMLGAVDVHGLRVDVRLERVLRIRKLGKRVGHVRISFSRRLMRKTVLFERQCCGRQAAKSRHPREIFNRSEGSEGRDRQAVGRPCPAAEITSQGRCPRRRAVEDWPASGILALPDGLTTIACNRRAKEQKKERATESR